jgi:hypothetical protein
MGGPIPRRLIALVAVALVAASAPVAAKPDDGARMGSVYANVLGSRVVLGNALVERVWELEPFRTVALVDKRDGGRIWSADHPDFTLGIGGVPISSEAFDVSGVDVEKIEGGLRVTFRLALPGLSAERIVETYNGVAGFYSQTVLTPSTPIALSGATLDEAAVGDRVVPTIHAFRAGADWREPGWEGPALSIGDPHAGTWRDTRSGQAGASLEGAAQWLSVADGARSLFMVAERNDQPSTRAGYDGQIARLEIEYAHDVVGLGPFEEDVHVENSSGGAGRMRLLAPGESVPLSPAFVGFGLSADDEPWQFQRFLSYRLDPYENAVTFNSNGTDTNRRSTGAKDDMDFQSITAVAPIARRLGIETFILDDGWQAISGDWFPDCPDHPEPRWDGDPNSKFAPRFPDCEFKAVREAIAPMELGLWMSPMHFNPASQTYKQHPERACTPVGHALAGVNALDPQSGSNEAGIGMWGPRAIPHVEQRIRTAIEEWGVKYFKFDFLVWVDCAESGDLYQYHDAFVAMVDRLIADYPKVTFQIDETNDYRMFPFESVARGPSWFQNGSPAPERLLHNTWNLSPYVPAYSLGQHFLGGRAYERYPVDTLMAAALTSHMTFFSDLATLPAEVIDQAAPWIEFFKQNRDYFTRMIYPLLDDPMAGDWTALQTWDLENASGALLVFRQSSEDSSTTVRLRGVPPGMTFNLVEAPTGAHVGVVTSEQLTSGLDVLLDQTNTAKVLLITPSGGDGGA